MTVTNKILLRDGGIKLTDEIRDYLNDTDNYEGLSLIDKIIVACDWTFS